MTKSVKTFTECPTYSDCGSVNQLCRDILGRGEGEAPDLQIGVCEITGRGFVAEDAHSLWTQYFLVTRGRGTVHLNGKAIPVSEGMIVEIPKDTRHYASCEEGQFLQYFFINIY